MIPLHLSAASVCASHLHATARNCDTFKRDTLAKHHHVVDGVLTGIVDLECDVHRRHRRQ